MYGIRIVRGTLHHDQQWQVNFLQQKKIIIIMDKSVGTLAFLGRFLFRKGPTPPLTPQTKLDTCIQDFF